MTVNDAAMIVSITATCGGIFYKVCLSPLERSIDKLSRLIDEQSDMISNDRVKIAEVESHGFTDIGAMHSPARASSWRLAGLALQLSERALPVSLA